MKDWWPIIASHLDDPRDQSLTTAERACLESMISAFSQHGLFLEIAVTLGLSEDKVRRIRRWVGRPG